jgi:formamidopyrimidine-DNA glycosylase
MREFHHNKENPYYFEYAKGRKKVPEWPDVEVFRRYMDDTSLKQKIARVRVSEKRVLKDVSAARLSRGLKGCRFEATRRRGKFMFAETDGKYEVMFHFGMTGYLQYLEGDDQQSEHGRVVFEFDNGNRLVYVCQRLFGEVRLLEDIDKFIEQRKLGPDAMELSKQQFREIFSGGRGSIKSALMKQEKICGIGNIYGDEILYQSGIAPDVRLSQLSDEQIEQIYKKTHKVLKEAVERQADPARMPLTWLLNHRDEKDKCPRCGAGIKRVKISGRYCYMCAGCQKG